MTKIKKANGDEHILLRKRAVPPRVGLDLIVFATKNVL